VSAPSPRTSLGELARLFLKLGAILLLRFRVNATWLVLGGGLAGLVLRSAA